RLLGSNSPDHRYRHASTASQSSSIWRDPRPTHLPILAVVFNYGLNILRLTQIDLRIPQNVDGAVYDGCGERSRDVCSWIAGITSDLLIWGLCGVHSNAEVGICRWLSAAHFSHEHSA